MLEGLTLLHSIPQSAADKLGKGVSGAEAFADLVKALAMGGVGEAQKEVLKMALEPTVLAGGTKDDLLHRLWMHRQLTERFGDFLHTRQGGYDFTQQLRLADPDRCRVEDCWQRAPTRLP